MFQSTHLPSSQKHTVNILCVHGTLFSHRRERHGLARVCSNSRIVWMADAPCLLGQAPRRRLLPAITLTSIAR